MIRKNSPLEAYFTKSEVGCWLWQGHIKHNGYGTFYIGDNKRASAHVLVYEKLKGLVPFGLELDHLCRNRACVNPDHLDPVTRTVNARRGAKTKLNAEKVSQIKQRLPFEKDASIAQDFGVTYACIRSIRIGETWKEIK